MSQKDKPSQPSMNELYSNQQQMPAAPMGIYGMLPQQNMYNMGPALPPMNMGMTPQINRLTSNMNQMSMASNVQPVMPITQRGMAGGMLPPRQMGQVQGFGGPSASYTTYKGFSWCQFILLVRIPIPPFFSTAYMHCLLWLLSWRRELSSKWSSFGWSKKSLQDLTNRADPSRVNCLLSLD